MTIYKELHPVLWARHGGRAARLQESRAETGVVAAPRTEVQRMAVWDNCAGQLCREAWRMAGQDGCAEKPRGQLCGQRDPETGLLACRLALSAWDFSD